MWQLGIKDLIDILLVATLLYYLYRQMKSSGSIVLFQGVVAVLVAWLLVTQVFQMRLLGAILNGIVNVGIIVMVVIFQNEIRQLLFRVGSRRQWKSVMRFFGRDIEVQEEMRQAWVDRLVLACKSMSEAKVGALICIQNDDDLTPYIQTGDEIDAVVTTRLVEQIFYKNTPLHDAAMIIVAGRIKAASCLLPVSQSRRIPTGLGLRHRSAVGLTEVTDARVVIVSEETGDISVAYRGQIRCGLTPHALQKALLKR